MTDADKLQRLRAAVRELQSKVGSSIRSAIYRQNDDDRWSATAMAYAVCADWIETLIAEQGIEE